MVAIPLVAQPFMLAKSTSGAPPSLLGAMIQRGIKIRMPRTCIKTKTPSTTGSLLARKVLKMSAKMTNAIVKRVP
jgi:hypothetical protein